MIRDFHNTDFKIIARIYADQEIQKQLALDRATEEAKRWSAKKGWATRINKKQLR